LHDLNGYVDLLKPPGMSSAAAVAYIKRLTKAKCGHAGTLDPEVAGVLPVMVGRATRLMDYFDCHDKEYIGEISFTGATDTQDAAGTVTEAGRGAPDRDRLLRVIAERFLGDIMQVPPMYSAVKLNGRPLYQLARAGREASVQARPVTIYSMDVLEWPDRDTARLRIACSKGTYIRTLFHDIGQALGCPAHMRMLLRTRAGDFGLREAVTVEQLAQAAEAGTLPGLLLPPDWPLRARRAVHLQGAQQKKALNGVTLPLSELGAVPGETVRLYVGERLIGVGIADQQGVRPAALMYAAIDLIGPSADPEDRQAGAR